MSVLPKSYAQTTAQRKTIQTTAQQKTIKLPPPKEYTIGCAKVSKAVWGRWEEKARVESEADRCYASGDFKLAIGIYNQLKVEHPACVRYDVLADIYEKQGQTDKALQAYRIYVYDSSNGWDWTDAKGNSRAREVLSLVPTGIAWSQRLATVFRYVILLAKEKQMEEATYIYQVALARLGKNYPEDDRVQVADELEAIHWSQNPSHYAKQLQAAAWIAYGATYTKTVGEIKDTTVGRIRREAFQNAVDIQPDLALGQYMLGHYIYETISDINEAPEADIKAMAEAFHNTLSLSHGKLYEKTKTLWAEIKPQLDERQEQQSISEP